MPAQKHKREKTIRGWMGIEILNEIMVKEYDEEWPKIEMIEWVKDAKWILYCVLERSKLKVLIS